MAAADTADLSDAHTAQPSLKGRKAVITGGSTGIGRAIGVLLASEGVEIFTCGRDEQHLADGLARMNAVGKASGIALDLGKKGEVDRFFTEAKEALGDWDIAVINAAVAIGGVTDSEAAEARYALALDFAAYVMSAHKAAGHLGNRGDIVMIGSVSAHSLGAGSSIYSGIKKGIQGFAEALHKELGKEGIRVALVEPAKTGSDMQYPDIPAEEQRKLIGEGKMLRAEDIAVAVHFILTQPRRTVINQMVVSQRVYEE